MKIIHIHYQFNMFGITQNSNRIKNYEKKKLQILSSLTYSSIYLFEIKDTYLIL